MTGTAKSNPTEPTLHISPEQVRGYWEKGWLALPALFSADEVAAWDAECRRLLALDLVQPNNLRTRFRTVSGQSLIEKFDPVLDISPLFSRVANDPRILQPLQAIFNDRPALFKDKLIFKLPTMTGYTMHQDQAWWQMCPADDILSVSIAIDAATPENGCIELFPALHRTLLTPAGQLRNMNQAEIQQHIDLSAAHPIASRPGDVLIFHAQTPHRSGPNTTSTSRRSLYLTYTAARVGDLYKAHRDHYLAYATAGMSDDQKQRLIFR